VAEQFILADDDRKSSKYPRASHDRTIDPRRSFENAVQVQCQVTPTTDQTETRVESPLLAMALRPTRIVVSSLCSSWDGILLERHLYSPGERISASIEKHVISMSHRSPFRFRHRNLCGDFVAALSRPRTIMITPAGPVPDIHLETSAELTHCALDVGFIRRVADELDHLATVPVFRSGIENKSIQRIMNMLTDELETERPLGRLYVDSLLHALATRYLLLDVGRTGRAKSGVAGLVPRILNRVRAKIEANLVLTCINQRVVV
jgi:hypothetical protein